MTSTRIGGRGPSDDFYETPEWCVRRLLEAAAFPAGTWVDAGAGHGAIARAVNRYAKNRPSDWLLVESDFERANACRRALSWLATRSCVTNKPFLSFYNEHASVVIMNPPYSQAFDFVKHSLSFAHHVIALLPLGWLQSGARAEWLRHNPPGLYVLPDRPSFTGKGTDSQGYAWYVWSVSSGYQGVRILASTPKEERCRRTATEKETT